MALLRQRAAAVMARLAPRAPMSAAFSSGGGDKMTSTGMYNWRVEAVRNALAKRGKAEGPLTVEDLTSLGHLDQYHYLGIEACDHAAATLGLQKDARVLDVGSGIGGPARYLAMTTGCDVTGIELQGDLNDMGSELTRRVGLDDRVRFITGDFVDTFLAGHEHLSKESFDHVISLLVFLHIPNRPQLLKSCFEATKPGGTFLIEDFALVGETFTEKEESNLKNAVSANTVTSVPDYIEALTEAGFTGVEAVDLTPTWQEWTRARHMLYRENEAETVRLHGQTVFSSRVAFYEIIDELFAGGNLGGVQLTGVKPGGDGVKAANLQQGLAAGRSGAAKAVLNEHGSAVKSE